MAHGTEQRRFGQLPPGPARWHELLTRLGPTFVKLGQLLALRPDLIAPSHANELILLVDQAPPFPWPVARAILESELGPKVCASFTQISAQPVTTGALAQAHLAHLRDGTEVVVKIQRPGAEKQVQRALRRAQMIARILDLSGASLIHSPADTVNELSEWLHQELDFESELENLSRLHQLAAQSCSMRIPRPYPALSSKRIVTSEYLRGVPFSELLRQLRQAGPDGQETIDPMGLDRDRLAKSLVQSWLTQIFQFQFFDADVHPGNLLALPGNVIGLVNFGLCDELGEGAGTRQRRFLEAGFNGRVEQMYKALMEILVHTECSDEESFRRAFLAEAGAWLRRPSDAGRAPLAESSDKQQSTARHWLLEAVRLARRHQLRIPSAILAMYRALATVDSVARQLSPTLELSAIGRTFLERIGTDEIVRALRPRSIESAAVSYLRPMRDSPDQLQQLLFLLSEGRLGLNVKRNDSNWTARASNRRTSLISASILSVVVSMSLAIGKASGSWGAGLTWLLSIALAILFLAIALLGLRL